jgi:hypothetical protein
MGLDAKPFPSRNPGPLPQRVSVTDEWIGARYTKRLASAIAGGGGKPGGKRVAAKNRASNAIFLTRTWRPPRTKRDRVYVIID